MKLNMRGEDGSTAVVDILHADEARNRTAEWLAEGDYDPLDAPVEVRGFFSFDADDIETIVRIRLTGGSMIDGYEFEII